MKISERIKGLFRRQPRQPPTAEELAARAEAERSLEQYRQEKAVLQSEIESREGGPGGGAGFPPF
jgi:hypothetical protein